MRVGDFVNRIKNKKTNQERLDLKKLKLRECDLDIDELLNTEIKIRQKKRSIF